MIRHVAALALKPTWLKFILPAPKSGCLTDSSAVSLCPGALEVAHRAVTLCYRALDRIQCERPILHIARVSGSERCALEGKNANSSCRRRISARYVCAKAPASPALPLRSDQELGNRLVQGVGAQPRLRNSYQIATVFDLI